MSKIKSRLIRMVSIWDILIGGIISWFIHKLFDFLLEKGKRVKFEGKTHIKHRIFVMFGEDLLMIMFYFLFVTPEEKNIRDYQESLKRSLRLHRRYHQLAGNELCCVCRNIIVFKFHLEEYAPDPELYPPFNF